MFVNQAEKQGLLSLALLEPDVNRALVFTRTKHGADRVVKRLAQVGLLAIAIHGNKSQGQRQRALAAFREGEVKILVATDIAARGIDIEGISHVINYEIPNVPEQYVHRIGRTARANREGKAIAFVSGDERKYLKDIQKLLKTTIPVVELPEDFLKKVAELKKTAKALPPPPKNKPDPRKGRGKSKKKKARFSKDRKKKDGRKDSRAEGSKDTSRKPHRKGPQESPFKDASNERPAKKSWSGEQKPRGRKKPKDKNRTGQDQPQRGGPPNRMDGESRAQRKARNKAKHAQQHSRRKPRPDAENKNSDNKGSGNKPKGQNFSKNKAKPKDGSEAPKKPHQRYGKRNKNRRSNSGPRKGPNKS